MNRYQRQTILPEIGQNGQNILSQSSIVCIGAGGLGTPVLQYLTAAGIGRIGIVDDDSIDLQNLQRQILYTESDIGKAKAVTAAKNLQKLNSTIAFQIFSHRLDAGTAENILGDYDVILDCSDNFTTKYLLNDAAYKLNKPLVTASVLGWRGQVTSIHPPHSPCYRCLFTGESQDAAPNCAEAGVIGALAGTIGTIQATEAIKLCLGSDFCAEKNLHSLWGNLLVVNGKDFTVRKISYSKNPLCPVCSQPRNSVQLKAKAMNSQISCDSIFIDVREQDEWNNGHIEGAIHLPLSAIKSLPNWDAALSRQQPYTLYCQMGGRSKQALEIFKRQGFTTVNDLSGGYANYKSKR